MVDFKAVLTNPWVLGGGAALALVLVLTSRGSGNQVVDTGTVSNYSMGEWIAHNTDVGAQLQIAGIEAATSERLSLLQTLMGFAQAQQTVAAQLNETAAGITKTRIETEGALRLDRQQGNQRYNELITTTNASSTLSMRQADLDEMRIRESSNLSRLQIGAAVEQGKRTLDTTYNVAKLGAATERKQIKAATRVGVAQARAAEKAGVAQAEAAPWVSFWSGASQVAGSLINRIPAIPV